jgi:hypothetical protein
VVRKFEYSKVYIYPISGHGYSRLRARPQAMTATRTNLEFEIIVKLFGPRVDVCGWIETHQVDILIIWCVPI